MAFTNGTPQVATEEHIKAKWGGMGRQFRCQLCGHAFQVGDAWRFIYSNFKDSPVRGGNFIVCAGCDGPDVLAKRAAWEQEARQRFWELWEATP